MNGEQKLPPALQHDLQQAAQREDAAKAAGVLPLPGAAADGFPAQNVRYKDYVVRPVVASDMVVMQKLDSPFLKVAEQAQKPEDERQEVKFLYEDMIAMVYLMTHPAKECYALAKDGAQAFKDKAIEETGALRSEDVSAMFDAIGTQTGKVFKTVVEFGGEEKEGRTENFPVSSRA